MRDKTFGQLEEAVHNCTHLETNSNTQRLGSVPILPEHPNTQKFIIFLPFYLLLGNHAVRELGVTFAFEVQLERFVDDLLHLLDIDVFLLLRTTFEYELLP